MKKNNILNYLFICIVINLIPIILLGIFEIQNKIYSVLVIIMYMVQTLIMFWAVKPKIKETSKKVIVIFIAFFILQVIVQIFNYIKWSRIEIKDIANIFSCLANIYIFVYLCSKFETTKEEFIDFMKKIVIIGIISCIYNVIANWNDIINIVNIKESYDVSISSFFPNRNQYAIFMLICIIANLYIIANKVSKKYIAIQILFIISIILTMSRNAILGLAILYGVYLCLNFKNINSKLTKKQKIIIVASVILFIIIATILLIKIPDLIENINKLFIRTYTVNTESGRLALWINGFNIFKDNPILGVGRFTGVNINMNEYNSPLDQFHNIYVETLVSYGIVGLIGLIYLFYIIIKKILNSKLGNTEKKIMLSSIIVFLAISCFETTTRFSIGYADTISMIYFFTIPLICANMNSKEEENE